MTNAEFERFLELSIQNFADNYIDYSEEWEKPHEFSEKYKKKKQRLIKMQRKPYYKLICTTGRRAACIAAALLIASGAAMSVKAVRECVIDFIVEHFSDHDKISIITDSIAIQ